MDSKPRIVKAAPCSNWPIKLKIGRYGLYLGSIWWNTGSATDENGNPVWQGRKWRWHRRFDWHLLENSAGVTFWDKKYW